MGIQVGIAATSELADIHTIEDASQLLFSAVQGLDADFAANPDTAHSKWTAALESELDPETQQILDEITDADGEDESSEIEWEDDEFDDYDEEDIDI